MPAKKTRLTCDYFPKLSWLQNSKIDLIKLSPSAGAVNNIPCQYIGVSQIIQSGQRLFNQVLAKLV
jgi:hypothetical protein